jgi:3-oxoacyl-[acyl-carrier protein] reductase
MPDLHDKTVLIMGRDYGIACAIALAVSQDGGRARVGGSMVNTSTSMVRVAPPELSAYAASKAAVDVLTRILAKELRGRDITVNAVAPGPTATAAFLSSTAADEHGQLAAMPPLGRLGRPDDIAGLVSFLVGPAGRWVNGQVVYANGGLA